jgi:hypothetical protein
VRKSYGSTKVVVTCPVCKQEVVVTYEWDNLTHSETLQDSDHVDETGNPCAGLDDDSTLSTEVERTMEGYDDDDPYGGDGPDD